MPRDIPTPIIEYRVTDSDIRYIKDIRQFPNYVRSHNIPITEKDSLDEIATRKDIYGDDAEDEYYRIFEFNAALLIDNGLKLINIGSLDIPSREQ